MNKKLLVLGLDAALPDLVKKFADEGHLPNMNRFIQSGIFSRLITIFPPLTAAAWTAIVSGAGSGTNGVPSLMVKHVGEELDDWSTSFDRREVLCETLWDVNARMGGKTALINWPVTFPMGAVTESQGIQLGAALNPPFRYFYMPLWDVSSSALFSNKQHRCNQIPGRAVVVEPEPADDWQHLPDSFRPPLGFSILVPPTYVPGYTLQALIYASNEEGYDRILISETKDASQAITDITLGDYGPWIVKEFEANDGRRKGRFRFQIFELSKDGVDFKLYQSAIHTAENYSIPEKLTAEVEALAGPYMEVDDPWALMDGWMPHELYMESMQKHADWWGIATRHVLQNYDWDMAFSWVGTIDHAEHILYAGITPQARVYDPERAEHCMTTLRKIYRQVDENIGRILEAVDLDETYVLMISDHGFTHLDWNPYVKEHFSRAGLLKYILDMTHDDPSNLTIDWENTLCHPLEPCHAHIFINLKGRDPQGIVEPEDYAAVQERIIDALYNIRNPETGESAVSLALRKEEAGTVGIFEGPGYDRVGDVIYAWKPGYMSHPFIYRSEIQYRDGTTRVLANPELFEPAVLGQNFTGVHLALPSLPDMHAVMVMGGPGVEQYERKFPADIIDVAPTLSTLLGIDIPKHTEGGILYDVLAHIK